MKPAILKTIIVVILIIAIAVGSFYYLKKKKDKGGSGGNNGGGGGGRKACSGVSEKCKDTSDCCENYSCSSKGTCEVVRGDGPISSFFLETHLGNVENDNGRLKETTNKPTWTSSTPPSFWSWDGIGNLSILSPKIDANGSITSVQTQYIQSPTTADSYVSLGSKSKVILTKDGAIYNTDYTMCVNIDDTHNLIWKKCLTYPYLFTINAPSSCTTGKCSNNSECCAPYKSCLAGQCVTCFGDPLTVCPDPATNAVCENGVYKCVSKCKDSPRGDCGDNQISKCVDVNGKFEHQCVWKCEGQQPVYCSDGNSQCAKVGEKYEWKCPENFCNTVEHHPPDSTLAPPPSSDYKYNEGHFEKTSDASAPWMIPVWHCESKSWKYQGSCNLSHKKECPVGQKAVCDNTTEFGWKCVDHTEYPNLCGASASSGDCGPDARCFDLSACGGQKNNSSDWSWVCPSSVNTPICQLFEINNWPYPATNIANENIYFKDATTPIYPTVRNDRCRDPSASFIPGKEFRSKINNPNVLIEASGTSGNSYNLTHIPTTFHGNDPKVFTLYNTGNEEEKQWHCASDNPCSNGGSFIFNNPNNLVLPRPDSYFGPPTSSELLQVGKCVCPEGFAGATCQYSKSVCSNAGYPTSCNINSEGCIDQQYHCVCENGRTGSNCQYSDATTCNGNGKVNSDGSCVCNNLVQGEKCNLPKCMAKIKSTSFGTKLGVPYTQTPAGRVPASFDVSLNGATGSQVWNDWIYDQENKTICLANPDDLKNPLGMGGKNLCLTVSSTLNPQLNTSDPFGCNGSNDSSRLVFGNYSGGNDINFQRWALNSSGELLDLKCPSVPVPDNDLNPVQTGSRRCVQVDNNGYEFYLNPSKGLTNGQCATFSFVNADESYASCPQISLEGGAIFHTPLSSCNMNTKQMAIIGHELRGISTKYYDLNQAKNECLANPNCDYVIKKQGRDYYKQNIDRERLSQSTSSDLEDDRKHNDKKLNNWEGAKQGDEGWIKSCRQF